MAKQVVVSKRTLNPQIGPENADEAPSQTRKEPKIGFIRVLTLHLVESSKMAEMIRIGDFARLAGISVATLRLYDDRGLLAPAFVDPESSYRYYRGEQLADLYRIGMLQDLGFSLREIKNVGDLEMPELLTKKLRASERRLQIQRQQITKLGLQIRIIQGLLTMTTSDVKVLTVPEMTVAAIHLEIPTNDQVGPMLGAAFGRLYETLRRQGVSPTGPCLADGSVPRRLVEHARYGDR